MCLTGSGSMRKEARTSSCECCIEMLDGFAFTLLVQLEWTISTIKDRIEEASGIPSYAQVLSDADRRLFSEDVLHDVYLRQGAVDERIWLFLARLDIPRELGAEQCQHAWEAFRMYSVDSGETLRSSHLKDVSRFLNVYFDADDVQGICGDDDNDSELSFRELTLLLKSAMEQARDNCLARKRYRAYCIPFDLYHLSAWRDHCDGIDADDEQSETISSDDHEAIHDHCSTSFSL